jgi:hypothetical protein
MKGTTVLLTVYLLLAAPLQASDTYMDFLRPVLTVDPSAAHQADTERGVWQIDGWIVTCETGQQPQRGTLYYVDRSGQYQEAPGARIEWRLPRPDIWAIGHTLCPYMSQHVGVRLIVPADLHPVWIVWLWNDGAFGNGFRWFAVLNGAPAGPQ